MLYPPMLQRFLARLLAAFVAIALFQPAAVAQVKVVTQHNDNARTGANLAETILNTGNVNAAQFGKLFSRAVTGFIYSQPLYLSGVAVPGSGTHNVVYTATMNNDLYAFDADDPAQAAPLWHVNFGPARTVNLKTVDFPGQQAGVLSTPVIDPGTNTLYVVSNTSAGTQAAGGSTFYLHALDAATGQEKFGGPTLFAPTSPGTANGNGVVTMYTPTHIQRPGLLLSAGRVYVAFSSTGDMTPYHGWIVAYSAGDLTQPPLVYNDTPNGGQGGIWQGGNGPAADAAGNIYAISGNGSFDTGLGPNHGNSMIKLDSTLHVLDWFTPHDSAAMNASDLDLGSSGLMGIPGTNYFIGGGKTSVLYLVDAGNMGHYNANTDGVLQKVPLNAFHMHGGPIYWNSPAHGPTIYCWAEQDYLKGFSFAGGLVVPTPVTQSSFKAPVAPGDVYGAMPGGILSLSANGSQAGTGIVWANIPAQTGYGKLPGVLRAFDADNLTHELWDSTQNAARDGYGFFGKFANVTVAGGKVYVPTSSNQLAVYGLLPPPATGGTLTGAVAVTGPAVSLTAAGTSDWAHWGLNGPGSFDHKAAGGTQISDKTVIGRNGPNSYGNDPAAYSWTDGTPTGTATNTRTGIYVGGVGNGFSFTVPADTTTRTLTVYVGGYQAQGLLTATLSDGSAAAISDSSLNLPAGTGGADRTYTLTYAAASAGQHLTVSWTLAADNGNGNVNFQAATLAGGTTAVAPPAAPTGLTATPGNTTVSLGWNAVSGATSYSLYRGTASGGETLLKSGLTVASYADTGLTNGTAYFYQVTATGPGGEGAKSAEASATPVAPAAPPAAPAGLTATPGNATVALAWNAVSGATSYDLYRGTASGGETLLQSGLKAASYSDTGLVNGATYYYQVSAVGAGGESAKSAEAKATPVAPVTPPAAPTGLTATPGNGAVSLAWNAVSGATSYSLYRGTASGGETLLKSGLTAASYSDVGLVNGTAYFYQVTATGPGGEGAKSAEATATPVAPPPGGGTLTGAVAGSASVNLTTEGTSDWAHWGLNGPGSFDHKATGGTQISPWTLVGHNGPNGYGDNPSRFSWTDGTPTPAVTSTGTGIWVGGTGSGFSFTVPADTTARTLRVYVGVWRARGQLTATLSDGSAATFVDASAVDAAGPGGGVPVVYTLTYSAASAGQHLTVSWTVKTDGGGNVNFQAATLAGGAAPVAPPAAPTGLTATPGNTTVSLGWNAVSGATGYSLYRGTASGGETLLRSGLTAAAYSDTGLTNGTAYFYQVTATGPGGEGAKSAEASATPVAPLSAPPAPTGLTATPGNGAVALGWAAVSGATSYSLYRGTASGGETLLKSGLAAASYSDTGLTNGTAYFYQVTATGPGGEGAKSAEATATPVAPPPGGGTLTGSSAPTPAAVSLTAEGTLDWAHWGLNSVAAFDHKATGGTQISNKTIVGRNGPNSYTNNPSRYSWTDGVPTAAATNTGTGIYVGGTGSGFSFTVPADTTARTLRVYVGVWRARGQLTATLSDGSAATFVDASAVDAAGPGGGVPVVYTLSYSAASAGQKLTVSWTVKTDGGGNVNFQAATLTGGS